MAEHSRAWQVAEYLGLVSDKPRPKVGSRQWWLNNLLLFLCGVVVILVARWLGLLS